MHRAAELSSPRCGGFVGFHRINVLTFSMNQIGRVGVALLVFGMVANADVAASAPCEQYGESDAVFTRDINRIPKGGAVLVGRAWYTGSNEFEFNPKLAHDPTSAVRSKGADRLGQARVIAPGLRAFEAAGRKSVRVGKVRFGFTAKKPSPTLAAPKPSTVRVLDYRVGSEGQASDVTLTLTNPVPTNAVAVVVYGVDAKGVVVPRSWQTVVAKQTEVTVYQTTTKPCGSRQGSPLGSIATSIGDTVRFGYVDQFGAVSPMSDVVTVVAAPPRKQP